MTCTLTTISKGNAASLGNWNTSNHSPKRPRVKAQKTSASLSFHCANFTLIEMVDIKFSYLAYHSASVNSSPPGICLFGFSYGWGLPGGEGTYAFKCPAVGTKVEGKCPVPKPPLNLWPDVKCADVFWAQTFLIIHGIVLDLKFPYLWPKISILIDR